MKTVPLTTRLQFQAMFMIPFIIAAIIIAAFFGCQQKPKEPVAAKPQVTIDNLQIAYSKAASYKHMYELFATRAEKDRLKNIASLFRAVAQSEGVHAKEQAELLKAQGVDLKENQPDSVAVGSTIQTMKMALSSEDIEVGSMYPNLIRTADAEHFKEAKEMFEHLRDADARQKDLLEVASNGLAQYPKADYLLCPKCGYIFNDAKMDDCPICGVKKQSFVKV